MTMVDRKPDWDCSAWELWTDGNFHDYPCRLLPVADLLNFDYLGSCQKDKCVAVYFPVPDFMMITGLHSCNGPSEL